jgi:hypothetical protein
MHRRAMQSGAPSNQIRERCFPKPPRFCRKDRMGTLISASRGLNNREESTLSIAHVARYVLMGGTHYPINEVILKVRRHLSRRRGGARL